MSQSKPQVEATEAATTVEKLTDDAIKNERAKLQRMIVKRIESRKKLDTEIVELQTRDTLLLTAQIERLTRQLPATKPVGAQVDEKEGEQ